MAIPDPIRIYRMVHWQNVEYILSNGMCCREHDLADPDYINIGHRQLITDRHDHPIPLEGAGVLGEYVPFYFAGHSPMLYCIMNGYQGVEQRPQNDIVFLASTFDNVRELDYIFTDRQAKKTLARAYNNPDHFDELQWDIIKNRDWKNNEENPYRQEFKQAEFLIKTHIPLECMASLVVLTEERKEYFEALIEKLELDINVFVDDHRKLYY
ncbi:MAG: hypothetical protein ACI9Z3_001879 [Roseivirga sp.]|jgi:hypothetical protein